MSPITNVSNVPNVSVFFKNIQKGHWRRVSYVSYVSNVSVFFEKIGCGGHWRRVIPSYIQVFIYGGDLYTWANPGKDLGRPYT